MNDRNQDIFFPNFPNFRKRVREISPPVPSSYARDKTQNSVKCSYFKNKASGYIGKNNGNKHLTLISH